MKKIEAAKCGNGEAVQFRVRWTTVEGERGVVWEWSAMGTAWEDVANWSDPNGPVSTKAEAREWAIETIASWPSV